MSGAYFNVSGGAVVGGGYTGSFTTNDGAWEGGLYLPPQLSINVGWAFRIDLTGNTGRPIWEP